MVTLKNLLIAAAIAIALAAIALAPACGITGDDDDNDEDRELMLAPIDGIDILVRETAPPQYVAEVLSGLPSGCAEFHSAEIVEREGTTIRIRVLNSFPTDDRPCTAIYGTHESNVELGTDFESGQTYTVEVNDASEEFTAQ